MKARGPPFATDASYVKRRTLSHLGRHESTQAEADPGARLPAEQVVGAAEEVERERQARQRYADDVGGLQRLPHIVARAEHDLGDPERVQRKDQDLQPPACTHASRATRVECNEHCAPQHGVDVTHAYDHMA